MEDYSKIAKVLLLMATPSKEDIGHLQFGIQWNDHTEAIPANLAVATSRYSNLVSLVRLVARSPVFVTRVPDILHSVFTTPGPWLPENVASVLLLLGPDVTASYLKSLCKGCVNCLNKAVINIKITVHKSNKYQIKSDFFSSQVKFQKDLIRKIMSQKYAK